jgi:hypothetical protein
MNASVQVIDVIISHVTYAVPAAGTTKLELYCRSRVPPHCLYKRSTTDIALIRL